MRDRAEKKNKRQGIKPARLSKAELERRLKEAAVKGLITLSRRKRRRQMTMPPKLPGRPLSEILMEMRE